MNTGAAGEERSHRLRRRAFGLLRQQADDRRGRCEFDRTTVEAEFDLARAGGREATGQRGEQRRLADAVRPDQSDPVAGRHDEVDIVEHEARAARNGHPAGDERCNHAPLAPASLADPVGPEGLSSQGYTGSMPAQGEHHPAFEEYCECIYELGEDDVEIIQARIAERLQISRPAVSEMMKRLEAEGLITSADGITLTAAGQELGERVVRRHRLAERFLTDILKLSWAEAHHEAGRWEHVISESVEQAINDLLGDPTTCPHGNPIPGSNYKAPDSAPLSDVVVGVPFTVRRITEELEFAPGPARVPRGVGDPARQRRHGHRGVTRRNLDGGDRRAPRRRRLVRQRADPRHHLTGRARRQRPLSGAVRAVRERGPRSTAGSNASSAT